MHITRKMHLTDDEFLNDWPRGRRQGGGEEMSQTMTTMQATLRHYRDQARLAQFERMREALRVIISVADASPKYAVGDLIEHLTIDIRAILKDVEEL